MAAFPSSRLFTKRNASFRSCIALSNQPQTFAGPFVNLPNAIVGFKGRDGLVIRSPLTQQCSDDREVRCEHARKLSLFIERRHPCPGV